MKPQILDQFLTLQRMHIYIICSRVNRMSTLSLFWELIGWPSPELIGCPPHLRAIHTVVSEFGGGGHSLHNAFGTFCVYALSFVVQKGVLAHNLSRHPHLAAGFECQSHFFSVFVLEKTPWKWGFGGGVLLWGRICPHLVYAVDTNCAQFCLADFLHLVRFFQSLFLTLLKWLVKYSVKWCCWICQFCTRFGARL